MLEIIALFSILNPCISKTTGLFSSKNFSNRDLLKVNPQDGRRGMLKGIHTR